MFFADIILKTLFLGVLVSLTGNDYTSETSDHAVVTATARESGVLDDLIEGVEEQCSSTKSSGTESFVKNCNHFTNETSLQCFLNLKGASNVIVHQNITEKGGEKDPQLSLEWKNEKQLRETSNCPNLNGSTFCEEITVIIGNIRCLLELTVGQKALLLLVYVLCCIWKCRRFVLSGLNRFAKAHLKCILPGKTSVKRRITDSKAAVTEYDNRPSKSFVDQREIEDFKKDDTISCVSPKDAQLSDHTPIITAAVDKEDQQCQDLTGQDVRSLESYRELIAQASDGSFGDDSDDDFPDEFFVVGGEDGNIMLSVDDWEPITPTDSISELHRVEEEDIATNLLHMRKEWKLDDPVSDEISRVSPDGRHGTVLSPTSDSQLSRSDCQDELNLSLESKDTNLPQTKDMERDNLIGDGKSRVTSPPCKDQDDKIAVPVPTHDSALTNLSSESQEDVSPSLNHEDDSSGLVSDGKSRLVIPPVCEDQHGNITNDSVLTSLSSECQDTPSLNHEDDSTCLVSDGKSLVIPPACEDQHGNITNDSVLTSLSSECQDTPSLNNEDNSTSLVSDGKSLVIPPACEDQHGNITNDSALTSLSSECQDTPSLNNEDNSTSLVSDGEMRVTPPACEDQHGNITVLQLNDSALTSLSSDCQDTPSLIDEDDSLSLVSEGDSRPVTPPACEDQYDNSASVVNKLPGDGEASLVDLKENIAMRVQDKCSELKERFDELRYIVQIRDWTLDNLPCDDGDTTTVNYLIQTKCPKRRVNNYKSCINWEMDCDDESSSDFFLHSLGETKNIITVEDIDKYEVEYLDDMLTVVPHPEVKTARFIPPKPRNGLNPDGRPEYDDVTVSRNADVVLLGNQGDLGVDGDDTENGYQSPEEVGGDQFQEILISTEDNEENRLDVAMNSFTNHIAAALFFSGTFVLPCLIAAKVLK